MFFGKKKVNDKEWEKMNDAVLNIVKNNNLDEALAHAYNLYEITKKNYGNKHENTITTVNNLGFIHLMRKEFSKAESYLLLALELSEDLYGKYSKEVALINANLSQLYLLKTKEAYEIDSMANEKFKQNQKTLKDC